jgi:hypothetical protein
MYKYRPGEPKREKPPMSIDARLPVTSLEVQSSPQEISSDLFRTKPSRTFRTKPSLPFSNKTQSNFSSKTKSTFFEQNPCKPTWSLTSTNFAWLLSTLMPSSLFGVHSLSNCQLCCWCKIKKDFVPTNLSNHFLAKYPSQSQITLYVGMYNQSFLTNSNVAVYICINWLGLSIHIRLPSILQT